MLKEVSDAISHAVTSLAVEQEATAKAVWL
jgi:hypothetical protein